MICYKDMTFCKEESCVDFNSCSRALTNKVKQDANDWWGKEGAPIAFFVSKPDCYKEHD